MDKQTFIARARDMQADYKPSADVREHLSRLDLIAVVGPTGVGKSTIIENSKIPYVPSDVTRSPRDNEVDGKNYFFWSDFAHLLNEVQAGHFVQYVVEKHDEFYGTKITSYPPSGACTMAIIASVIPHFRTLGFRSVVPVYIVPPTYEEWMRRMYLHNPGAIEQRLAEARESLGIALEDDGYVFLLNDDLDEATQHFIDIVEGRRGNDQAAKDVARQLLERISELPQTEAAP